VSRANLQWENTLNLVPAFKAFEDESVEAAGKVTAQAIRELRKEIVFPSDWTRDDVQNAVEELDSLADSFEDELCNEKLEYNFFLDQLYELGNQDKLIWVATEQWQVDTK
jgi:hypothetical protein